MDSPILPPPGQPAQPAPAPAPQIPPPPSAPPVATASPQPVADAPLAPGETRVWGERPVTPRRVRWFRWALFAVVSIIVAGATWAAGWWALPIPIGFTEDSKTPIFIWLKARRDADGDLSFGLLVDEESLNKGVAERYGDRPEYRRKVIKAGVLAAMSGLRPSAIVRAEKLGTYEGFCDEVPGTLAQGIDRMFSEEMAGSQAAMGITREMYRVAEASCFDGAADFAASVPITLEDGTETFFCVSSDGSSRVGEVARASLDCAEPAAPAARPAAAETKPTLPAGQPTVSAGQPIIVAANFPAALYDAESVHWEYRRAAGTLDGFCASDLYRDRLGAALAEWGTSVACEDTATKFAVAAADADLGIIACADWTGYARPARGIVDASCDFIDAPEPMEPRP